MPLVVLVVARLITAMCVLLLLIAVAFDAQVGRVTSGTVPAESAARVRGDLDDAPTSLLVVGHNVGDDIITATDAVAYGVGAVELDVRDIGGQLYASHDQPLPFIDNHLETIVRKYKVVLEAFRFDPQKVAKNEGSYDLIVDAFETELLKLRQAA